MGIEGVSNHSQDMNSFFLSKQAILIQSKCKKKKKNHLNMKVHFHSKWVMIILIIAAATTTTTISLIIMQLCDIIFSNISN